MVIRVFVLTIIGICLLSTGNNISAAVDLGPSTQQFSLNAYSQISNQNKDKSIIFSPFSIQTAGALLYNGANGKTGDEILTGFSLPGKDKKSVSDSFEKYIHTNPKLFGNNGKLTMGNKLFISKGYTINPSFIEVAVKSFDSEIENVDFGDANGAVNTINNWVSSKTNGKIQDLVQPNDIDGLTRMFLVNAIHFKAEWDDKFDPKETEELPFSCQDGTKKNIPMMKKNGDIDHMYYYDLMAYGISLKFKDSDLSLFAITTFFDDIPLEAVEAKLKNIDLNEMFNKVSPASAQLLFPKFKIELTTDLETVLRGLGVEDVFSEVAADLSGLAEGGEKLHVSSAVHKASIEINEEGGEASAATSFGITGRMGPASLIFNKPFIYFIKSSSGEIFFMGKFTGN